MWCGRVYCWMTRGYPQWLIRPWLVSSGDRRGRGRDTRDPSIDTETVNTDNILYCTVASQLGTVRSITRTSKYLLRNIDLSYDRNPYLSKPKTPQENTLTNFQRPLRIAERHVKSPTRSRHKPKTESESKQDHKTIRETITLEVFGRRTWRHFEHTMRPTLQKGGSKKRS